ncbi:aminotransferase, class-II [Brucella abortus]|uniref:Aminotransferase, class-II n=1 Tax=Brucella abortus (strain 2308) TaxID=359391 RepID=Q2YK27_BRUA2|nr:Aminotransferase, class-II [Brucella abortus 2308]SHO32767.1 aminotransferase, class-II [Brucella abortus]
MSLIGGGSFMDRRTFAKSLAGLGPCHSPSIPHRPGPRRKEKPCWN